ncbi:hypothetical protein [Pseudonocardia abyssalis]|uniref:TrbL/VirB6 plasmid conjugal transfer protein n=1 Tax=Pseudonocardia abyssalis TaxID=2792008 RepID=A0ABS6US39_9PSEU|nr:hypothetical protein [Pseudonocardia abyssalis]MBW0117192.1 hypothetical protein [Pseudonocardia abyssalis]MBW0135085.1 hypothetical protein [Pseudonocardia abyssalis]
MITVLAQAQEECGTFDLGCKAGQAVGGVLQGFVATVAQGAADLVVSTSTWWATTDSVDPRDSAVIAAQGATSWVVGAVLVGSVLVQAIRLILSRKAEPLIMVATGLFRFAVVSALGLTTLHLALQAGDALAVQLLADAANNFALFMVDALTAPGDNVFVTLIVAVLAAILSLVQWLLMAMRQAGLLVLAAMLPLAASGSLTKSTRGWLDKLIVWLLAMVLYKPAAAFIYYIGFSYLSSPNSNAPGDVSTQIAGIMVLLLAVIAMPIMLKFFSWSGTQIAGSGGGGSGFIGAAGAIALAQGSGRSPAVQRAVDLDASGPGSAGPGTGGGAPPPAGAAPGAASGGGGAPAGAAAGSVAGAAVLAAQVTKTVGTGMTSGAPDADGPT